MDPCSLFNTYKIQEKGHNIALIIFASSLIGWLITSLQCYTHRQKNHHIAQVQYTKVKQSLQNDCLQACLITPRVLSDLAQNNYYLEEICPVSDLHWSRSC